MCSCTEIWQAAFIRRLGSRTTFFALQLLGWEPWYMLWEPGADLSHFLVGADPDHCLLAGERLLLGEEESKMGNGSILKTQSN